MTTASNKRKASTAMTAPEMVGIVITVDHVYLPLDADGNVVAGWTASNVFTSKVLRRTHLKAPADLARFLTGRDQAEITTPAAGEGVQPVFQSSERSVGR